MRHCILKIVVVSILLFGILGVDVVNANIDETCNSVTNVFLNKTSCDRKSIVIEGEVRNLNFSISDNKNKYTVFNISEGDNNIVVFSYGYLPLEEGDEVRVTGTYYIEYAYGNYTFYDELVTIPSQVVILDYYYLLLQNYILIGLLILTLGISITIIFYLRKKNPDIMTAKSLEEIIGRQFKEHTESLKNPDIMTAKSLEEIIGRQFEEYTESLFNDRDWKLWDGGPDRSMEAGRVTGRDSDPDFEWLHRRTKKSIAVECKYMKLYADGYGSSKRRLRIKNNNLKNYKKYQRTRGIKTYILFGVGGKPSEPKDMYLIPLDHIDYNSYPDRYLEETLFSKYKIEKRVFQIEDFTDA
ncbi:MAG: hypothetical protein KAT05_10640 [Spirochaetes bacterium]|nr:hypothetical protein [Spirochaetota bacterium]